MHPLAWRDNGLATGHIHLQDAVRKHPRRIDHRTGFDGIRLSTQAVHGPHTCYLFIIFDQTIHAAVIQQNGPLVRRRLCQTDSQPCVVELPVMIDHTAP